MHAVDRLAGIHEPLQGRQHEAVAAEPTTTSALPAWHRRSAGPAGAVPAVLRPIAGDEGDPFKSGWEYGVSA